MVLDLFQWQLLNIWASNGGWIVIFTPARWRFSQWKIRSFCKGFGNVYIDVPEIWMVKNISYPLAI